MKILGIATQKNRKKYIRPVAWSWTLVIPTTELPVTHLSLDRFKYTLGIIVSNKIVKI